MARPGPSDGKAGLARRIGLVTAVACGVGSVIGSGIFKKPGVMAGQLGSPELLIGVWVVAGLMTLFGALSIAEIAGMGDETGGQYVYFKKSYNRFAAYLYGWSVFAVIQTGSIASIAYVFSDSLSTFVTLPRLSPALEGLALPIPFLGAITPLRLIGLKLCTIGVILFLTLVNYLGVRFGGGVQVVFSALKVLAIAAIVALVFGLGHGSAANFTMNATVAQTGTGPVALAFFMAMSGAFWAYDGWINVTYVAGEIRNAQKNLPRAMAIAALIYIGVYLLVNLAYIYMVPVAEMGLRYAQGEASGAPYLVATDAVSRVLGPWGSGFIALAIMVSTFGAVNGTIMMSARVYHAMSLDGLFFRRLGGVHPRFRTPGPSLVVQGIWASLLVLSGTFDQLTDMLIFVSWIFYAAAALGVIVLRRRLPDAPRPYRVWGYPVVPILFVLFALTYVGFTLYSDIQSFAAGKTPLVNSVMGLVLVAIGIPGYLYWSRKKEQPCDKR